MPQYQGVETLEILEGAENYNQWIVSNFLHIIESPILEIGAGTGNISKYLLSFSPLFLTDIDNKLVKYLSTQFNTHKITNQQLDICDIKKFNHRNYFKTVLGINVLEHIKDDILALQNIYKLLREDGRVLLLVPAKKQAFTRLDKELGHYRRYEKEELRDKLQQTGFEVEKMFFFNSLGLLSWIIRDKIERTHNLKPYQIKMFDAVVPLLRLIESHIRPPTGISLIAVGKRKK